MNIAVFNVKGVLGAAWNVGGGIVNTLRRMGHNVWDINVNEGYPPLFDLLKQDLVIVSGMEWNWETIRNFYHSGWSELPKVVAMYHESMFRDDRNFWKEEMRGMAHMHCFAAKQDAETLGGAWYPFGVDTEIFRPMPTIPKSFDIGFIGQRYGQRDEQFKYLAEHAGLVHVQSPAADSEEMTARVLAKNYNSIKVFVNLPAYSRLLVTKVTEAMACGLPVLTPRLTGDAAVNMEPFCDGEHIMYYDSLEQAVEILKTLDDRTISYIANAGCTKVRKEHTLENRLASILFVMGFGLEPK